MQTALEKACLQRFPASVKVPSQRQWVVQQEVAQTKRSVRVDDVARSPGIEGAIEAKDAGAQQVLEVLARAVVHLKEQEPGLRGGEVGDVRASAGQRVRLWFVQPHLLEAGGKDGSDGNCETEGAFQRRGVWRIHLTEQRHVAARVLGVVLVTGQAQPAMVVEKRGRPVPGAGQQLVENVDGPEQATALLTLKDGERSVGLVHQEQPLADTDDDVGAEQAALHEAVCAVHVGVQENGLGSLETSALLDVAAQHVPAAAAPAVGCGGGHIGLQARGRCGDGQYKGVGEQALHEALAEVLLNKERVGLVVAAGKVGVHRAAHHV